MFVSLLLTFVGLFSATNTQQMLSSLIYLPLILYFGSRLIPRGRKETPKFRIRHDPNPVYPETVNFTPTEIVKDVADNDRRIFLKLIGSAGFSLLFMALFTKKAQAAFFGSMPGPGTVAIKNSAGVKIDPAESHPTDGYEIAEIDDTSSPAYYGFLKKNGYWYITKETSAGSYRYTKGTTSFSTNWTNRASLTYDYFDSVFG